MDGPYVHGAASLHLLMCRDGYSSCLSSHAHRWTLWNQRERANGNRLWGIMQPVPYQGGSQHVAHQVCLKVKSYSSLFNTETQSDWLIFNLLLHFYVLKSTHWNFMDVHLIYSHFSEHIFVHFCFVLLLFVYYMYITYVTLHIIIIIIIIIYIRYCSWIGTNKKVDLCISSLTH